jgi:hydroxymethylbilane synthase
VKSKPIRIGTRGSALALAQSRAVASALEREGRAVRVVIVETEGDRRAPDTAWGEGAFVAAIERALLDDRVDAAVHSAKDVPTEESPGLRIAAYLPREDPSDVLVVREGRRLDSLDDLPRGARVGTDSPRRQGFLLAARPDLQLHPLHGNVDTRLRRLDDGETDALVLAAAGLLRLGRADRIGFRLAPELVPPAAGQGAIAVQVRSSDARTVALAASIDDGATRVAVETERHVLSRLGGGCRAPIGVLARLSGGNLGVVAGRVEPDGGNARFARATGDAADAGTLVSEVLHALEGGAREPRGGAVLVTRPRGQSEALVRALNRRGVDAVVAPTVAIEPPHDAGALESAVARGDRVRWFVVTSANGAQAGTAAARAIGVDPQTLPWATIGPGTAAALGDVAVRPWLPSRASAAALGEELPVEPGDAVVLLRGSLADATLPAALAQRGADVVDVEAYRTSEAPADSRAVVERELRDQRLAAVVFASPSAVRGLLALAGSSRAAVLGLPAVCIGSTTAAAAQEHGFGRVVVAARPDAESVAEIAAEVTSAAVGARW